MSYLTLESLKASHELTANNIDCELIDLVSLKPLNYNTIFKICKKNKKIISFRHWFSIWIHRI